MPQTNVLIEPARRLFERAYGMGGRYRFQTEDGGGCVFEVGEGRSFVTEGPGEADVVFTGPVEDLTAILMGRKNLMAAATRGDIRIEGNLDMAAQLNALLPAAPAPVHATPTEPAPAAEPPAVALQAKADEGVARDPKATVSVLVGDTFVLSDRRGDFDATPSNPVGLFHADTRYLSRWVLTINGQRLMPLAVDNYDYDRVQFFLVLGTGEFYIDSDLSVLRRRSMDAGFREELLVVSHAAKPVQLNIRLETGADFADLFEVKEALRKKGDFYRREEGGQLALGYQREHFSRETRISSSEPATIDERGLSFEVTLAPHAFWRTTLDVDLATDRWDRPARRPPPAPLTAPMPEAESETWIRRAPRLTCSWRPLERTYRRSLVDLAALRFSPMLTPGESLPAAGLPWFMTLFGRDSLITSLQVLPFIPDMARTTLRVLGARQGTRVDPFRDEEPGKILHESRRGEMTAFEERPHSPYFGTADATPLFLILLDEYERWTGDVDFVRGLERQARAALRWIDEYGDRDGDGYVEYLRGAPTGLENQCWKDSWNSILFNDGTLAKLPRATCEIQGYVYDAKRRMARLARKVWDDEPLAVRLETEAASLKAHFNRDFWIADRRFFALALDGDKRQVDSLTSNIGHLLWSDIVDEDKIQPVVDHLMSDQLFSGWGIRTMSSDAAGHNPVGYHIGTVWPFDTAIVALGLARAGRRAEATRMAMAMLEAAVYFDHRLPEAFAGYTRSITRFPVEYPTACSPQAWSTGAPFMLLRVLLGLDVIGGRLLVDPAVPESIERLELVDLPGPWGRADAFARGRLPVQQNDRSMLLEY